MAADNDDLLSGAAWQCTSSGAGLITTPNDSVLDALSWIDASVPGTVAAALEASGARWDETPIDSEDWWYRTSFVAEPGSSALLELDGLATFAEVWLNDLLVAETNNMFLGTQARLDDLAASNALAIRFRSVEAEIAARRPRPRWRVARLSRPNLRWVRTSLLGRLVGAVPVPAPVGPWREIRLLSADARRVARRVLRATPASDGGGLVTVEFDINDGSPSAQPPSVEVLVGNAATTAEVVAAKTAGSWTARAQLCLDTVERWWPHSMGDRPLYEVVARIDGTDSVLGRVGFRDLRVDRTDDGFRFVVNDVDVFVGGACWMPVDPVSLAASGDALRSALQTVVDGNLRMLRVSGDTVYESDAFYDLCDELGILLWQDCMLAFTDPPHDDVWEASFLAEVEENLGRLSGRPCIALVSGGSEIAQQAAYAGVALEDGLPLLTDRLPKAVERLLGDVPYLPTSPWGGDIPTRPDTGVAHYYGVGAYLRRAEDARLASPRFAAECLAFAVPPQRQTVDRAFGSAAVAGHDPRWKRAIFRDAGASWDFEDVRDHYVRELFDVDPLSVRYTDPERYLDLGRATVATLCERVFAEWRRGRSPAGGGLVFYLRDSLPGAGMGLIDAFGLPKAPWYAMRRVLAPVALSIADEGLNGLVAHVHNDTAQEVSGTVQVDLFVDGELLVDSAERDVVIDPGSSMEVGVDALFDGFRDLAWAHRFGPLTYDVVAVRLIGSDGRLISEDVHLPGGLSRPVERDLGLEASLKARDETSAEVTVSTRRYAQFVTLEVPGWFAEDSGFPLTPGRVRTVRLERQREDAVPVGAVYALNGGSVALR